MVLFYGIPRQVVNVLAGWKGSGLTEVETLKFQAFAWCCAFLHVKGELIWLPPLLRDLCRKGLTLRPPAFLPHWLYCCGTAELRTGSSSPWKWLHAQKFRNWMPLSNTSDDFPRCFPISSSLLLKVFLSQRDK